MSNENMPVTEHGYQNDEDYEVTNIDEFKEILKKNQDGKDE